MDERIVALEGEIAGVKASLSELRRSCGGRRNPEIWVGEGNETTVGGIKDWSEQR
jgi:hypothetical protein